MADISKIKALNGTTYNIKDATARQNVSGKADKVTTATNGNFAALDANGNLKDSGHKHSDYLTSHQDISGKADKVHGSGINGNFAALDANGNLIDSGHKHSDYAGAESVVTNANGTAVKFPSGLMVCYKSVQKNINMTAAWGNLYEGAITLGNWPEEFISKPRAVCSNNNSTGALLESWSGISKTSCGSAYFCRPISAANVAMDVTVIGFGMWK